MRTATSIVLGPPGITITAAGTVTIAASQAQNRAGMLTVDAGMARFSGAVQCDTPIANSVVASSYTPGVGNIA
jgi:hypothetical protein